MHHLSSTRVGCWICMPFNGASLVIACHGTCTMPVRAQILWLGHAHRRANRLVRRRSGVCTLWGLVLPCPMMIVDMQGYPGTLIATVTYIMTREGMLRIIFEATTDKQTPVNLVQHSYFNLAGHAAGNALDQVLYINGCAADFCSTVWDSVSYG